MKVLLFLQIVVRVLFLNHLMNKAGKICMIGGFSVLFSGWMEETYLRVQFIPQCFF